MEAALKLANEAMKLQFDKPRNKAIEYKKGQLVWLDAEHIKSLRPTKKLNELYFGPFAVEECISQGAYKLKLPDHEGWNRKHPVFNEKLWKPVMALPLLFLFVYIISHPAYKRRLLSLLCLTTFCTSSTTYPNTSLVKF